MIQWHLAHTKYKLVQPIEGIYNGETFHILSFVLNVNKINQNKTIFTNFAGVQIKPTNYAGVLHSLKLVIKMYKRNKKYI